MCSYLFDVAKTRQQNSNAVIVVGAGVLGRSSLLDSQIVENFERSTQQQTTREVVQKLARKAAYWVAQVIVEVPPEAQLRKYT